MLHAPLPLLRLTVISLAGSSASPYKWSAREINWILNAMCNAEEREKALKIKNYLFQLSHTGVMGEYEPKIEVQFPETLPAAKGSTVKLECFALGK